MGRAKIAMEFITKEKSRNATYVKRKKGLIKKCHEFSILCNVPLCIIIYPYKEGKQLLFQPEVYAFQNRDESFPEDIVLSDSLDLVRARDPEVARQIINRYILVPKEEKGKRALNLCDMLDDWKRKANQELNKLRQKNALVKYPSWDPTLDGMSHDKLVQLLVNLDQKLEMVGQRVGFIKGSQVIEHAGLSQFYDPTPVSSLMNPSNVNYARLEVVNQFSMFNYHPMGNAHQDYNQIIPFDPNGYAGQADQAGVLEHGGGGGVDNNNLVMYNMNMMGMGSAYYDHDHQGLCVFDPTAVGASSSYGNASLPMSMLSSVQMPRQCQMFYDN